MCGIDDVEKPNEDGWEELEAVNFEVKVSNLLLGYIHTSYYHCKYQWVIRNMCYILYYIIDIKITQWYIST